MFKFNLRRYIMVSGQGFSNRMDCRFGDTTVPAFNLGSQGINEVCFDRAESVNTIINGVTLNSHVSTRHVHQCMGRAVQVDPMKPMLEAPGIVCLRPYHQ